MTTENTDLVILLQKDLKSGRSIDQAPANGFVCLNCGHEMRHARVTATQVHEKQCLWRYFVHCQRCNYESNLAKCIGGYECECRRG